jgi:MATE family multidrug resistance protein
MRTNDRPAAASGATSQPKNIWRDEMAETIALSVPIALTQLGQIAMMTTDLMLLGRLGEHVVAGAGLAHTMLFVAFAVGMGLVAAVAPLAAQAFGARDPRGVRRALRVGVWAAILTGVPLTALQFCGEGLLVVLGQSPENAAVAGRYLAGLGWSLIPAWVFMAIRGFMGAVNRPEPALWITLAAVPSNFVLAWALIHGEFGLPRLDVLGAGVATTLVNIGMCAVALVICVTRPPFKKYRIMGRFWRFDAPLFSTLCRLGLPISGAYLVEFGVFGGAGLLMGTISTTALAAHQITLQIAAILFMVPFGISLAATVRVGHAVGRGDPEGSRRAGIAALVLGRCLHGADDGCHRSDASRVAAAVSRNRHSGYGCHRGADRDAATGRARVLRLRRHSNDWRRRAARAQRHARSVPHRHLQLLGDRIHVVLGARHPHGTWAARRVARPLGRIDRTGRAARVALPPADGAALTRAPRSACVTRIRGSPHQRLGCLPQLR